MNQPLPCPSAHAHIIYRATWTQSAYCRDKVSPAEEKDSLLEEQSIADQLAEEELIVVDERQGEFVISVLGEVNMLLSIQPLVCESEGH